MKKESSTDSKETKKKKPKKTGPVRVEALAPASIVFGLLTAYFMLFFDIHLKHGIEYGATLANGAEVNIGRLSTSFLRASLEIGDIEVTDAENPARNLFQIGEIKFVMLVDALLRGKVVINDASILDIQLHTARKNPGKVQPPATGPGIGEKSLEKLKSKYSGNVLGDIAAFTQGEDPSKQLSKIKLDLKSSERITELNQELKSRREEWQKRLDALPSDAKIRELRKKLNETKTGNDPLQVIAALKELNSIRTELDSYTTAVKDGSKSISDESKKFKTSINDLDSYIKKDVNRLQEHFHIPKLDAKSLSGALFGDTVLGTIFKIEHYINLARSYMPVSDPEEKDEKPVPPTRSSGINYAFGRQNSYPKFWLKKAVISSSAGNLSGELTNFTTSPAAIGKPMVISLRGSLPAGSPAKDKTGVKVEIVIDHTTSTPMEQLKLELQGFAVADKTLTKSADAELGIASARANSGVTVAVKGDAVAIQSTNSFHEVKIKSSAKTELIREVMDSALSDMATISVNANAKGTWKNLDLQISSNIGTALEKGFAKYLQKKFEGARKQIEELVKSKIAGEQKALLANHSDADSFFKDKFSAKQKQSDGLQKEIDAAIARAEKKQSPANKLNTDVLKKFKKPF